ncbi:MAG: flagellar biosynthetic protein FliR [Methylococcaceae bacterium]
MNFTEAEIVGLVSAFIWPFIRISSLFLSAPVFSATAIPARVRVVFSLALTIMVMPLLPPLPDIVVFSYEGLVVAIQQLMIGVVSGFILQLCFAAVAFAGQSAAYSLGLGFSSQIDPQNGGQVLVVSQFYVTLATLLFFTLDAHLLLLKILLDSFKSLPIGVDGIDKSGLWAVVAWASRLFAGGVLMCMPITISLLLVNICFGVATRAAPQLNIFSVGLPVTIVFGILMVWLTLPDTLDQFSSFLTEAYDLIGALLRV